MPSPLTQDFIVTDSANVELHVGFKNLPDARVVALKIAEEKNISTKVVRVQRQDVYTATVQDRPPPVEDNNP